MHDDEQGELRPLCIVEVPEPLDEARLAKVFARILVRAALRELDKEQDGDTQDPDKAQ